MKIIDSNSLFRSLDQSGCGAINAADILHILAQSGNANGDARLAQLRARLNALKGGSIDEKSFESLQDAAGQLLARAQRGELIIPDFANFSAKVEKIFTRVAAISDGKVADYIPQLARISGDRFAVSMCTIDGQSMQLGDADEAFTLQSSCKPVLYCAALEELGEQNVHKHVGREPSGLSFNELSLNASGLPHNPMINAGAIMTSSLIRRGLSTADRLEFLSHLVTALSGNRRCHFNNAVWHSERETADRNFALAHHMRERGAFPEGTSIESTLDYYFSACSTEVTATAVATIGATFANGGMCPETGERVFGEETVKNCLSMMYSCGMYDYSGEFAFTVGIPAKSSVSGVILAVIPNVMGIAVWSPRLDACGNSVRGVAFLRELVDTFSFHNYDSLVASRKEDPRRIPTSSETSFTYRAIQAASVGDIAELKRLIAHGHNLDLADYDGRSPLHLACADNQADTVRFLLDHGVATSPKDRWGVTPLADARKHKRKEIVSLFAKQAQVCEAEGPARAGAA
jgi:glutaminase